MNFDPMTTTKNEFHPLHYLFTFSSEVKITLINLHFISFRLCFTLFAWVNSARIGDSTILGKANLITILWLLIIIYFSLLFPGFCNHYHMNIYAFTSFVMRFNKMHWNFIYLYRFFRNRLTSLVLFESFLRKLRNYELRNTLLNRRLLWNTYTESRSHQTKSLRNMTILRVLFSLVNRAKKRE